jgi:hypothetical protein
LLAARDYSPVSRGKICRRPSSRCPCAFLHAAVSEIPVKQTDRVLTAIAGAKEASDDDSR